MRLAAGILLAGSLAAGEVFAQTAEPAAPIVKSLREVGVLATRAGEKVVRLLPPLIIKRGEIETFLEAFEAAVGSAHAAA